MSLRDQRWTSAAHSSKSLSLLLQRETLTRLMQINHRLLNIFRLLRTPHGRWTQLGSRSARCVSFHYKFFNLELHISPSYVRCVPKPQETERKKLCIIFLIRIDLTWSSSPSVYGCRSCAESSFRHRMCGIENSSLSRVRRLKSRAKGGKKSQWVARGDEEK